MTFRNAGDFTFKSADRRSDDRRMKGSRLRRLFSVLHRGVRNYLWYWVVMLALAVVITLLTGAPFGVVMLGVVFFTFMLLMGVMFTALWLDMRRRRPGG
jgi:hypothetical protein